MYGVPLFFPFVLSLFWVWIKSDGPGGAAGLPNRKALLIQEAFEVWRVRGGISRGIL